MTSPMFYLTEGIRHFNNSRKLKRHGFKKYTGSATEICHQIISDCWNGTYFQTSTTNFPQFWTRDFGLCTESLIKLGHKEKVKQTLTYALTQFQKHNKITTTITPNGIPINIFTYAIDSLAWLLHSLILLNDKKIFEDFRLLLENEAHKLYQTSVNKSTGLVINKKLSSIKDFAVRQSSCYDNCMLAVISQSLEKLNLSNPFENHNYKDILIKHFWTGKYFYDDLKKMPYVASDANIFPFYFNIISDKSMLCSAIAEIQKAQLDKPYPIKYTQQHAPVKFIAQELFMRNYERDAVWLHLGPLFISVVKRVDKQKAQSYIESYTKLIETYKNYPEVLTAAGKPFTAPFYHCDQGMLWAANYLALNEEK